MCVGVFVVVSFLRFISYLTVLQPTKSHDISIQLKSFLRNEVQYIYNDSFLFLGYVEKDLKLKS